MNKSFIQNLEFTRKCMVFEPYYNKLKKNCALLMMYNKQAYTKIRAILKLWAHVGPTLPG